MKSSLLLLTSLLAAHAADTPSSFGGMCVLRSIQAASTAPVYWFTSCRVDDLPDTTRYHNRFRIRLLGAAPADLTRQPFADYVKTESDRGMLSVQSILWGQVTVIPSDPGIVKRFLDHPGFEVRPQVIESQTMPDYTDVLVTEPQEDFQGGVGSSDWLARHADALKALGGAK